MTIRGLSSSFGSCGFQALSLGVCSLAAGLFIVGLGQSDITRSPCEASYQTTEAPDHARKQAHDDIREIEAWTVDDIYG